MGKAAHPANPIVVINLLIGNVDCVHDRIRVSVIIVWASSHTYISHTYISHTYISHTYISHTYISHTYISHTYISHTYISHTYIKVRVMTNWVSSRTYNKGPVISNCHQGGVGSSEMDTNFIRNKSRQTIEYKFIFLTIKEF